MLEQIGLNVGLIVAVLAVLGAFFSAAIKILREYDRGVVFTLGRYSGTVGPGLVILIPFVQQMVKVDMRIFAELSLIHISEPTRPY